MHISFSIDQQWSERVKPAHKLFTMANNLSSQPDNCRFLSDQYYAHKSPSKFFSAFQWYCSRLSVVLLSYDSRLTLIRLDCWKNWSSLGCTKYCTFVLAPRVAWGLCVISGYYVLCVATHPIFSQLSSGIALVFQSVSSRTIADRLYYNWSGIWSSTRWTFQNTWTKILWFFLYIQHVHFFPPI